MSIFHRQDWTQFWLTLSSDEVLGVLDSSYIEDYDGTDGQVTLRHLSSGVAYPVVMLEIPSEESAPHEVFRGWVELALLPDGDFQVQGRVRDVVGNYTILGAYSTPLGGEQTLGLDFSIDSAGSVSLVTIGPLRAFGGAALVTNRPRDMIMANHLDARLVAIITTGALIANKPVDLLAAEHWS